MRNQTIELNEGGYEPQFGRIRISIDGDFFPNKEISQSADSRSLVMSSS